MQTKAAEAAKREAYWTTARMQVHAKTHDKTLTCDVKVQTEADLKEYFLKKGTKNLREWVVIHDFKPRINTDVDKMVMHVYIKSIYTLVDLYIAKVYMYFDDIGRIILLSQLAAFIDEEVQKGGAAKKIFKLPLEMAKYVALAGDDPTKLSPSQIAERMQQRFFNDPRYFSGFLSTLFSYQDLNIYPPANVDDLQSIYFE
jgi:hypothetical protein